MPHSRLIARLEYDIKHLLWRAQVHRLSREEISHRFEQIKREYLQISAAQERGPLIKTLEEWEVTLAGHHSRDQAASTLTD